MKIGSIYNDLLLTEEITSGSVIVYHRTGRKVNGGSPIKGMASDGYRVGRGAYYGVGVYTTYELQSQLGENMKYTYGNMIIESKILSMDKFLIFDYDVAKKIYGNKNYTLDNQLRLILGKEWDIYKDNWFMNELINKIGKTEYTSEFAKSFYEQFKETIIPKLRGMVFTGAIDGKVLVSYDRKNVEPLRYTMDEGETWTNILDKNVYKRMQTYKPDKIDLDKEHFRNRFETNRLIPTDIDRILSSDELINKFNSDGINFLLYDAKDKKSVINRILSSDELINNLDFYGIVYLFKYAEDKDAVIHRVLSSDELINKLDLFGINYLLRNANDINAVINRILSSDELINKLDLNSIAILLEKSEDKDAVINRLLSSDKLINKLDSNDIEILLYFTKDKESVINRLLKSGVSKDEINKGINNYNSFNSNNTLSLIPEGYKNKIKKLLRNK
jgi:hypothetical protein